MMIIYQIISHVLALLIYLNGRTHSLNNGLLKTPPMGWLSWERFRCQTKCDVEKEFSDCISEKLFTQIADALVEKGYKDAGYDRVNIDDCWMDKSRDVETGRLMPDPVRFPNGIRHLSNYMHNKGLKLGIYQNYGKRTCMGYPGLIGHGHKDADTFAEWEVDMIKLDACFTPTSKLDQGFMEFGRMLSRTGRPIAYSCSWPYYQLFVSRTHIIPNWNLISLNCNMFRVYHDIHANWPSILDTIDFMADNQAIFRRITGEGSWPDPDMLLIGDTGLSLNQAQAQMAVWCILPAPLFMSNDPRTIGSKFQQILLDKGAIEINQDKLASPGERVFHNTTFDVWRRELSNNQLAVVILNRLNQGRIKVEIALHEVVTENLKKVSEFTVVNVFAPNDIPFSIKLNQMSQHPDRPIRASVPATGVAFLKLTPVN